MTVGCKLKQEINEICIDGYKFVIITSYFVQAGHLVMAPNTSLSIETKQVFGNVKDRHGRIIQTNVPVECED